VFVADSLRLRRLPFALRKCAWPEVLHWGRSASCRCSPAVACHRLGDPTSAWGFLRSVTVMVQGVQAAENPWIVRAVDVVGAVENVFSPGRSS
jgi:hypothetical protein